MAWALRASISCDWIPEGAGPQSIPSAQTQTLVIGPSPPALYNSQQIFNSTNDTLTAAQVNTACTALGSLAASYFGTIVLAELQAWPTGQP